MLQAEFPRGSCLVLVASPREVLASSLQAVLEPHGYRCRHVPDAYAARQVLKTEAPDIVILDEDLAGPSLVTGSSGVHGAGDIPVLLYSFGSWYARGTPDPDDDGDAIWDVIEEPIRTKDILVKLDRLIQLRSMWEAGAEDELEAGETGLQQVLRGLPILDSIASRSETEIGCVVLGPTLPRGACASEGGPTLRSITRQIRGSDLCARVGPSELVVFLYGAGIDALGQFVARVARGNEPDADRGLSAGIVALRPGAHARGEGGEPGPARVRVLERVAAARRALDRAREAGGGVRVAASR